MKSLKTEFYRKLYIKDILFLVVELYGIAVRKKERKKKQYFLLFRRQGFSYKTLANNNNSNNNKRVPKRTPLKQFLEVILNMKYV